MIVETGTVASLGSEVAVLGVPVATAEGGPRPAVAAGSLDGVVSLPAQFDEGWCARHRFTGKVGQTVTFRSSGGPAGGGDAGAADIDIVLVGVGGVDRLGGDEGREVLRRAAAALVRAVGGGSCAFVLPDTGLSGDQSAAAAAVAEGALLASYRFDTFRTGPHPATPEVFTVVPDPAEPGDDSGTAAGVVRASRLAESVALARDLVNTPPSDLNPTRLASVLVDRLSGRAGVTVEVWDEKRIVAERLGGLLGVARGSTQEPRLLRADYQPTDPVEIDGHVPYVALVGKGITFDSGGLSLKSPGGMETMKTDMGGAAAVFGAFDAATALGAPVRITAIAPITENMPSGSAIKPGDVLVTRNGKTIEVLNTDAEGRLVLADGLTLAVEARPDAIIDLATLTGAAVVALGKEMGALFGNDDTLVAAVRAAGLQAGENLWPMPLPDDYRTHIDSDIADMRNMGRAGEGGSIAAAMLLREFVSDVAWAHLDIAGPARSDDNSRYFTKGGTGFGVRTLVALITSPSFAATLAAIAAARRGHPEPTAG